MTNEEKIMLHLFRRLADDDKHAALEMLEEMQPEIIVEIHDDESPYAAAYRAGLADGLKPIESFHEVWKLMWIDAYMPESKN